MDELQREFCPCGEIPDAPVTEDIVSRLYRDDPADGSTSILHD